MKTVKYLGPHEAVVVPTDAQDYLCKINGTVDVPDELADALIKRGDWQAASSKSNKPAEGKES